VLDEISFDEMAFAFLETFDQIIPRLASLLLFYSESGVAINIGGGHIDGET